MKKKRKRIILIIIVLVLCFPIRSSYKDGGTVSYMALLYQVAHVHAIEDSNVRGELVTTEGYYVRILGFLPVYDSRLLTKRTEGMAEALPVLSQGKTGILRVMDAGGTAHAYTSANEVDDLNITLQLGWRNGCTLYVQDPSDREYAHFILAVGEDVTLWMGGVLAPRAYRFYFAEEDAPLPASWSDATVVAEQAAAARAAHGSFEAFAASRDGTSELELIRAILPEKAQSKADSWYDMLLEGLWVNGDVSVTFTDGYRDDRLSDWAELVLLGDDGRAYRLQGSEYFGYIRAVFCDETLYYGLPR